MAMVKAAGWHPALVELAEALGLPMPIRGFVLTVQPNAVATVEVTRFVHVEEAARAKLVVEKYHLAALKVPDKVPDDGPIEA